MEFILIHFTHIQFILVVVVLSSHHVSMLMSSGHDCAQSISTNMVLHYIGRQPCYESFESMVL